MITDHMLAELQAAALRLRQMAEQTQAQAVEIETWGERLQAIRDALEPPPDPPPKPQPPKPLIFPDPAVAISSRTDSGYRCYFTGTAANGSIIHYGATSRYERARNYYRWNEGGLLPGATIKLAIRDAGGTLKSMGLFSQSGVRIWLDATGEMELGADWSIILPDALEPGSHVIHGLFGPENPLAVYVEPLIVVSSGKPELNQDYWIGAHSAHWNYNHGGSGVARMTYAGPPLPCPLKRRPAVPHAEPKTSRDLFFQPLASGSQLALIRPSRDVDAAGAINQSRYPQSILHNHTLAYAEGPRGQATIPSLVVDGFVSLGRPTDEHGSPIPASERLGNCYFLASSGAICKMDATGHLEVLAGYHHPHELLGTAQPQFRGEFVGGYKNGWAELWQLAWLPDTIATVPVGNSMGAGHPMAHVACLVTDTVNGDLDAVVWDSTACDPVKPPRIFQAAHFEDEEPWGVAIHPVSMRVYVSLRKSHRIISGVLDQSSWALTDIRDEITPSSAPSGHITPVVGHRESTGWTNDAAKNQAKATGLRNSSSTINVLIGSTRIPFPEMIRFDSTGRLLVASNYTRAIYALDVGGVEPTTLRHDLLPMTDTHSSWVGFWLSSGSTGPVDSCYVWGWERNGKPWVFLPGGSHYRLFKPVSQKFDFGHGRYVGFPNYGGAIIPGRDGSYWMFSASNMALRATLATADDLAAIGDVQAIDGGQAKYSRGSIPGRDPMRPSLSVINGACGVNQWGAPHFQTEGLPVELQSDPQVTAYLDWCRSFVDLDAVRAAEVERFGKAFN